MARNPYRRYEVTEYQKEALKFLQPPEDITVSEWADKYRVLDAKTSAMPGPWRTEHTPYLKGIMDEFNNYETEEIVYVKPTQVGGTECLQNMVGYIVQQDPAPTMLVYPTDTLAKSISENRLQPMFKAAPELRKRFDENSQLQELQFDGMYLTLAGSNSPSSLASKAIRFLFLDEVDKYPGASKKEADPVSLARERTKTFHNDTENRAYLESQGRCRHREALLRSMSALRGIHRTQVEADTLPKRGGDELRRPCRIRNLCMPGVRMRNHRPGQAGDAPQGRVADGQGKHQVRPQGSVLDEHPVLSIC